MIKSKYGSEKVTVDGHKFDSRKEANRYCELLWLQKARKITNLELQKKYVLIPAQRDCYNKVIERECAYYADFAYIDCDTGELVVEDVKGYRDPASAAYAKYTIKRKLMLQLYGIRIKEI